MLFSQARVYWQMYNFHEAQAAAAGKELVGVNMARNLCGPGPEAPAGGGLTAGRGAQKRSTAQVQHAW